MSSISRRKRSMSLTFFLPTHFTARTSREDTRALRSYGNETRALAQKRYYVVGSNSIIRGSLAAIGS